MLDESISVNEGVLSGDTLTRMCVDLKLPVELRVLVAGPNGRGENCEACEDRL